MSIVISSSRFFFIDTVNKGQNSRPAVHSFPTWHVIHSKCFSSRTPCLCTTASRQRLGSSRHQCSWWSSNRRTCQSTRNCSTSGGLPWLVMHQIKKELKGTGYTCQICRHVLQGRQLLWLFALLHTILNPFLKGVNSIRKEFAPRRICFLWEQFFSLWIRTFSERNICLPWKCISSA